MCAGVSRSDKLVLELLTPGLDQFVSAQSLARRRAQNLLDLPPKCRRINRGVTIEQRLDVLEQPDRLGPVNEPTVDHLAHVREVQRMRAFDLRECLSVEVKVLEVNQAFAGS